VALPLFALLAQLPAALYGGVVAALLGIGIWAAGAAERHFERKDDRRIVIDEVVGQLVALSPLLALRGKGLEPIHWVGLVVTGFVAFRGFDIWKPAPVRWAERRFPGGAGVMLDDVVAGAFGAVAVSVAAAGAARSLA
jgi:phosphatidylglycerophosphatase A